MLLNYAQVKDSFKVRDRQTNVIGMGTEHSLINNFTFHITTNLQKSTTC